MAPSVACFLRSFSIRFCFRFANSSSAHRRFIALSSLPNSLVARLFTRQRRSLSLSDDDDVCSVKEAKEEEEEKTAYFAPHSMPSIFSCVRDYLHGPFPHSYVSIYVHVFLGKKTYLLSD